MCGHDIIPEIGQVVKNSKKESLGFVTDVCLENSTYEAEHFTEDGTLEEATVCNQCDIIQILSEKERLEFLKEIENIQPQ